MDVIDAGGGYSGPKIEVESWEQFLEDNEKAVVLLNECAIPIANVLANVQAIESTQTVDAINKSLELLETCSVSVLPKDDNLFTYSKELVEWFKDHAVRTLFSVRSIEQMIKDYNGLSIPSNKFEEYMMQFNGYLSSTSEMGVYWMLYYALNTTAGGQLVTPFGAGLSYLMVYGTDTAYSGGDFWIGDTVSQPFFLGEEATTVMTLRGEMDLVSWRNITTGACAVLAFDIAKDMLLDKGNYTRTDVLRTALAGGQGAMNYFVWTTISTGVAGYFEAIGIGASIAGPAGAAAATAAVIVILPIEKYAINKITGDEIVHTYVDENGEERQIPRNGTGRNKSYDVILGHMIGGNETAIDRAFNLKRGPVTLTEKISLCYNPSQNGYIVDSSEDNNYSNDAGPFNEFLRKVANASDYSEVHKLERDYGYYEVGDTLVPVSSITNDAATECSPSGMFAELSERGFSVKDYYDFTHDNYGDIAKRNNPIVAFELDNGKSPMQDILSPKQPQSPEPAVNQPTTSVISSKSQPVLSDKQVNYYAGLQKNGYVVDENEDNNYSYEAGHFNNFLREVANASDESELFSIERKYGYYDTGDALVRNSDLLNDTGTEYSTPGMFGDLHYHGFNVREYYAYTHGNYDYIASGNDSN